MVLRPLQRLPASRAAPLRAAAASHPLADPRLTLEPWYLQRWHCLPEGYLSRRSVEWYHRFIRRLYGCGRERAVAAEVAAMLNATGAESLADLGAGTGSLAGRIMALTPGVALSAFDLSPYCVDAARERLGIDSVQHADVRHLPVPDGRFDALLASHVLGHVPAAVAADILAEARRVLVPGGRLYTVEHAWHEVHMDGFVQSGESRPGAGILRVRAFVESAT